MNTHTEPTALAVAEADMSRQIAALLRRYGVACQRTTDLDGTVDDWVLAAQTVGQHWSRPLPIAVSAHYVVAVIDGAVRDVMRELRLAEALRGPRCADPTTCRVSIYHGGTIRTLQVHPWSHRG